MNCNLFPAVLLTGSPGVGKSTIISQVVKRLGPDAGGFLTLEVRDDNGFRSGFEIVTLEGERVLLATTSPAVKHDTWLEFGRYWINVDAVEYVAVSAIIKAMEESQVVIVDEVGPMELLSAAFCDVTWKLFDSNCLVVGTIVERSHPVADLMKQHKRVQLFEVTSATRDGLLQQIIKLTLSGS